MSLNFKLNIFSTTLIASSQTRLQCFQAQVIPNLLTQARESTPKQRDKSTDIAELKQLLATVTQDTITLNKTLEKHQKENFAQVSFQKK